MILLVKYDIILTSGKGGNDSEVHSETSRINHCVFLADIIGNLSLQFLMNVKGSVQKRGAGKAGAIFSRCLDSGFYHFRMIGKTHVAVGAEHEHFLAVHEHFCVLFA